MGMSQLIYRSRAIQEDDVLLRVDLMSIINEAVKFNAEQHIYGILYYGKGHFIQCLEGETEKIKQLYQQRIVPDPRHKELVLLSFQPIQELQFTRWNMKLIPSKQEVDDFLIENNILQAISKPYSTDEMNNMLNALAQFA